jgi:hypothetical protein
MSTPVSAQNFGNVDGLYYAYSIPMGLVNMILDVISNDQNTANVPVVQQNRADREWFSQPRSGSDTTTEVVQINFKVPLSVSQISFQALRMPCVVSPWYQDRNGNWIQMTDLSNNPLSLLLNYSATTSWFTYTSNVYPIVAAAVQLRVQRRYDAQLGTRPFVVGLKETLIRRNVYNQTDTINALPQQQDILGNTITSYIRNWDASNAIDNDPTGYWKSFPAPDPNAVVCHYEDLRKADGSAQLVDTVYIDPVYTGQALNIYYSNDDTQGNLIISTVQLPPDTQLNAEWTQLRGMADTSAAGTSNSALQFPVSWGPMVSDPIWIGLEWTPDFAAGSPPPNNPILFGVTPVNATASAAAGQFWPVIYYDVGAGEIVLEFTNGTAAHTWNVPLSPILQQYVPIQITVGWSYDPDTIYITVTSQKSTVIGTTTVTPASNLPALITLDGEVGYTDFRGTMTALVVKKTGWDNGPAAFRAGPSIYANPNPVLPDTQGNYPSTSLDNAILACDWTEQQFPIGGTHQSWFEPKTWTPIFANYVTQKGNLYLPQVIAAKFLCLEFTNLTAEPYPVYDQGIQVSYDAFPVSVTSTTTDANPGGLLGLIDTVLTLGADILVAAAGALNWLNPQTVQNAINTNFGQVQSNVSVTTGPGVITNSIPNTALANINGMYRSEQNNPYIYSRGTLNATYLAGQALATITGQPDSLQTIQSVTDPSASSIASAFTPVVNVSQSNVLPQQGQDWWLFPGANLKMPASVMTGLFGSTETVISRGPGLNKRVRFSTTCVHQYVTKTVTLDAAVGYFAGLNEVQAYVSTYIASNDPLTFKYSRYDPGQFVYTNINQEVTGPATTAGSPYVLANPLLSNNTVDLSGWTATGAWYWSPTQGLGGGSCAAVVANGNPLQMVSAPMAVSPGAQLVLSAWVAYYGATSNTGGAVSIGAIGYLGGVSQGPLTLTDPSAGHGHQITTPTGNVNGQLFYELIGKYTVPGSGIDAIAITLNINGTVTGGTFYWNDVDIEPAAGIEGTIFIDLHTSSTFSNVNCSFNDSGLVTSDAMWARADPLDTNIDNLLLAPYVSTIPATVPSGFWGDSFAEWADTTIDWGTPLAAISINLDPNLIYQGNRAVHFSRGAGAAQAGIQSIQQTGFVPNGLAQMECTFLKPTTNTNQITLSLVRVSDGVVIHTETFTPVAGYWYTYQSAFFPIPNTTDQVYQIEFLSSGDAVDELYLSNVVTNIAQIRYWVQLGGSSTTLFDVTPLRYSNSCSVSCTVPVQEVSLTVGVFSNNSWAYGAQLTPRYLK